MPKINLGIEIFKKTLVPLISTVVLVLFYGTYISKVRSALEINWNSIIEKIFFILMIMLIAYWLKALVAAFFRWYASSISEKTATSIDDEFLPLFSKIISILVWIIGIIIVLAYLGINIAALITTLGVGSLAIALAAQDTISNIIAGFLIMIDRPFKVGDEIKIPSGEKVKVLWIGNRRSKFRGEDDSIIFVPNLDLSKSKIVNYSYDTRS